MSRKKTGEDVVETFKVGGFEYEATLTSEILETFRERITDRTTEEIKVALLESNEIEPLCILLDIICYSQNENYDRRDVRRFTLDKFEAIRELFIDGLTKWAW